LNDSGRQYLECFLNEKSITESPRKKTLTTRYGDISIVKSHSYMSGHQHGFAVSPRMQELMVLQAIWNVTVSAMKYWSGCHQQWRKNKIAPLLTDGLQTIQSYRVRYYRVGRHRIRSSHGNTKTDEALLAAVYKTGGEKHAPIKGIVYEPAMG
jgi:hypothetical protein